MQKKKLIFVCRLGVLLTAGALVCAQVLLRNLSTLLSFDATFSAIFAQISTAVMDSPMLLILALSLGVATALYPLWQRNRLRFLAGFIGLLSWLILFLLAVLLTRVNGIRFCDVLFSLVDVLQKGGLS